MMIEYISREALLQDIEDSVRFTVKTGTISAEMRGANKIIDRIKCAPTADVEPVRHGRWVKEPTDTFGFDEADYHCSECRHRPVEDVLTKYCPWCGAKMR